MTEVLLVVGLGMIESAHIVLKVTFDYPLSGVKKILSHVHPLAPTLIISKVCCMDLKKIVVSFAF